MISWTYIQLGEKSDGRMKCLVCRVSVMRETRQSNTAFYVSIWLLFLFGNTMDPFRMVNWAFMQAYHRHKSAARCYLVSTIPIFIRHLVVYMTSEQRRVF
jgi:hypothetical protein